MSRVKDCVFTSVVCVVKKNNSYLFCRREDNGLWVLPGGRIEVGEKPEYSAVRELVEETGLTCKKVKLRANWIFKMGKSKKNTAVYEVLNTIGTLRPSWESPELSFLDLKETKKSVPLYVQTFLRELERREDFFTLDAGPFEYWVILMYIWGFVKKKLRGWLQAQTKDSR